MFTCSHVRMFPERQHEQHQHRHQPTFRFVMEIQKTIHIRNIATSPHPLNKQPQKRHNSGDSVARRRSVQKLILRLIWILSTRIRPRLIIRAIHSHRHCCKNGNQDFDWQHSKIRHNHRTTQQPFNHQMAIVLVVQKLP